MSAFERIIIFYIIYYLVLAPSLWGTVWEAGVSAKEFVPPTFNLLPAPLLYWFDLLLICCGFVVYNSCATNSQRVEPVEFEPNDSQTQLQRPTAQ